jgi:transcriptional regulator with XRE-family HTH domain
MSLFSDNIRHLRVKKEITQSIVAQNLSISRDRLAKYEEGKSQPPYEILVKISHYYHVSIDLLLSVDIRKIDMGQLLKLEDNRILLPILIDKNGDNLIEIIPHKAKAGYLSSYSDSTFIENLPQISLPWLGSGKYRAFPIEGDSMPPHNDKSYIVAKYIENLGEVIDGNTYILLTKTEGIVYKRLNRNGKNTFMLHSDNYFYDPYQINLSEILEIWEYAYSLETGKFKPEIKSSKTIDEMFLEIKKEIKEIRNSR